MLTYLISSTRNTKIWTEAGDSVDGPLMGGFILHQLTVKAIVCLLPLRCPEHTNKKNITSDYVPLLTLLLKMNYRDNNPQEITHVDVGIQHIKYTNTTLYLLARGKYIIIFSSHLVLFSFFYL